MQTISEIKKAHKEHRLLLRNKDRDPFCRKMNDTWFRPAFWKPQLLDKMDKLIFDTEENCVLFLVQISNEQNKLYFESIK